MLSEVQEKTPLRRNVTSDEVGNAAFLCSDLASGITGDVLYSGHRLSHLGYGLRDLEETKIRDLRRIFGCSFRCNVGRIVGYVTGVTAENTAEKTSKARILIFSKALRATTYRISDSASSST
jgi:hypothetical protein